MLGLISEYAYLWSLDRPIPMLGLISEYAYLRSTDSLDFRIVPTGGIAENPHCQADTYKYLYTNLFINLVTLYPERLKRCRKNKNSVMNDPEK